ncbi:hypothetical protein SDC9_102743 [bioreactor metagenome]|uniref:Nudix hydrolase domain-containing protein n=1 Tax=bioreactor metagenome TaxID=1076179 RepID=A0A645ARP3_9ZZZZ|nr:NUDIX hydrolase [Candidatus Metalachnospira sp.]
MKLEKFKCIKRGKFLNNYELTYINKAGQNKVYEMVSRGEYTDVSDVGEKTAGVIIAAFYKERVLLIREFRMGVNNYVYSFPAGLIDAGETPIEAARRELREETGMEITEIKTVLKPSYSCTGITDEKTVIVFCEVIGEISECKFADEEICSYLFTKEEVRALLVEKTFSSRAQAICYLWSKE